MLESMDLPLGVVLGTFGVERHQITWTGQAAHAGSTPMDKRRDALAAAAKLARPGLQRRKRARQRKCQSASSSAGLPLQLALVQAPSQS